MTAKVVKLSNKPNTNMVLARAIACTLDDIEELKEAIYRVGMERADKEAKLKKKEEILDFLFSCKHAMAEAVQAQE